MKIAIVSEFCVPFFAGGGEQRYYEVAKGLVAKGHDVTWVCMRQGKKRELDGINLLQIGPKIKNPPHRSSFQFIHYMIALFFHFVFHRYDVVDAQTFSPLPPVWLATLITRQKMFATIHDVASVEKDQWTTGGSSLLEKIIYKIPYKRIITVSHFVKKQLVKQYGIKTERIIVVHNGIDTNVGSPLKKTRDCIFVGRLVKHKHPMDFIKATKGLRAAIIGSGPLEKQIRGECEKNNVEFIGRLEKYSDVIKEIKKSKVLVLPSTREGLGLVIAEAGACDVPSVAYEGTGVEDIITQETGVLTKRNPKALREGIQQALKDKQMGERMKKRVLTNFSTKQMVENIERVYVK